MPSPWRMAAIINSTESVYIVITENSTDFNLHNGNCHDIQKTKEKVRTTATRLCARCRQNLFIICLVSKSKHHQKSDLDNEDFSSIHTARLLRSTLFCKHRGIVIDFACAIFECNGDQQVREFLRHPRD